MGEYHLSKTKILSGWQCRKRLWLEVHDPDKAEVSPATERAFRVGHEVGEIARRLVPGGILIGHDESLGEAALPYQVVLVDDGSRDATPDIVARCAERMPILVIQEIGMVKMNVGILMVHRTAPGMEPM